MLSASVKQSAVPVTSKKPADDVVQRTGDDQLALLPVVGALRGEQYVQHGGVGEVREGQVDDGTWSAGVLRQRTCLFQKRGAVVIEGTADPDDEDLLLDGMSHHSRCMNVHGRQHVMSFGHGFQEVFCSAIQRPSPERGPAPSVLRSPSGAASSLSRGVYR